MNKYEKVLKVVGLYQDMEVTLGSPLFDLIDYHQEVEREFQYCMELITCGNCQNKDEVKAKISVLIEENAVLVEHIASMVA